MTSELTNQFASKEKKSEKLNLLVVSIKMILNDFRCYLTRTP